MNVLFINANLHGHINPTLGLVRKLTAQGNKVHYFCSEPFSEQVTQAGAQWIGYGKTLDQFLSDYRPTDRHPFFMLMEYMLMYDEAALPEILDIVKKAPYDVILCDSFFGGACFLEQLTNIPVVCSHSSFAMSQTPVPARMLVPGFHPQLDHCYLILERICNTFHIERPTLEQIFISKGDLNIIYTSPHFHGGDVVQDPDYLFTGPSLDRIEEPCAFDFSVIGDRKLIYISLGSLNTDFVDFYQTCIVAFSNQVCSDCFVCMSIGKKCEISQIGKIPENFCVASSFPQLEMLKQADVFITHAGFNSVNEAIYFGVPMLALPQVNDQHMVARRLVSMQLGISENIKELSSDSLRSKTLALLADRNIKEHCIQSSREMKNSARLEQALQRLEAYVDAWKKK